MKRDVQQTLATLRVSLMWPCLRLYFHAGTCMSELCQFMSTSAPHGAHLDGNPVRERLIAPKERFRCVTRCTRL